MAPNPTNDWERLQDVFYRKRTEYVFSSEVGERGIVAGAPFGGAVVVVRETRQFGVSREHIQILNNAGALLCNISVRMHAPEGHTNRQWDKSIKGAGWTEDEQLVLVAADGAVRLYSDFDGTFTQFSLGGDVTDCRFYNSGFVARLASKFVCITRYDEPRVRPLAELPSSSQIYGWSVSPPSVTLSRHIELHVGVGDSIFVVDAIESVDKAQDGPFTHIALSPNGSLLALYTSYGKVYVVSSDFTAKYSEYDAGTLDAPTAVVWCANDCVAVAWESEIRLIGPSGGTLSFYYDSAISLIPEPDGIRIISDDKCEFLTKVPDVVASIFRIGATSPSAILLDAVDQLELKSPKADDNIQLIRPNLTEAVDACIKAASYEPEPYWQKRLLKAALLGKSVLELYSSDEFVEMCEILRVLNAVRYYDIAMPLTFDQFIRLTPERLIDRLISRHKYSLALKLSEYLQLATDKIYIRWACAKVRTSHDDTTIMTSIMSKLSPIRGISYEEIAKTAYDEGRPTLATLLLNHEPRAGKQVPLLLTMEQDDVALTKSVESGDPDLLFYVLLHLKRKYSLAQFFRMVNDNPVASAVVEQLARNEGPELLKDFYYQDDRRADSALVIYREGLLQDDISSRIDKLKLASKIETSSKDIYPDSKAMEDHAKLYELQITLEKEYKSTFVGLTVADTIKKLCKIGQQGRASKVKGEFKVGDKHFQFLRDGVYPVKK